MPWSRCIAIEYGCPAPGCSTVPISGIVQCATCTQCYKFIWLAGTPDTDISIWAFGRAHCSDIMQQLAAAYKLAGASPGWPVWLPPADTPAHIASYINDVESTVLLHCAVPELVLAASHIVTGVVLWTYSGPVHAENIVWVLDLYRQSW